VPPRTARVATAPARGECRDDLRRRQQQERQQRILAGADALLAREGARVSGPTSTGPGGASSVRERLGSAEREAGVTIAVVHAPGAFNAAALDDFDPLTRVFDAILSELDACGELLPDDYVERPATGLLPASRKPAQGH
jgi:hypothetical protein